MEGEQVPISDKTLEFSERLRQVGGMYSPGGMRLIIELKRDTLEKARYAFSYLRNLVSQLNDSNPKHLEKKEETIIFLSEEEEALAEREVIVDQVGLKVAEYFADTDMSEADLVTHVRGASLSLAIISRANLGDDIRGYASDIQALIAKDAERIYKLLFDWTHRLKTADRVASKKKRRKTIRRGLDKKLYGQRPKSATRK